MNKAPAVPPGPEEPGGASTWWSRRFLEQIEKTAMSTRIEQGRSYARCDQVTDLRIEVGLVTGYVQGSRRTPYKVRLSVETPSPEAWQKLIAAMAQQAVFLAKLLAHAMPPEAESVSKEAGFPLFPRPGADLIADCTCTDWASPCKHVVAVAHAVAEQLDNDPFLLLSWRGLAEEELLQALRAARERLEAENREHSDNVQPSVPPHFWCSPDGSPQLHISPRAARVPDALLRQLGPPPELVGGSVLFPVLSSFYRQIAKEAERLGHGAHRDANPEVKTSPAL